MTGFYPTYHGVRLNGTTALSQTQTTLAEAFAQHGYQTGAFVGAFVLDGRWGLNQGFGVYDDQFDLKKFKHIDLAAVQRPANEVIDAALHWLDARRNTPFFAWLTCTTRTAPTSRLNRFVPSSGVAVSPVCMTARSPLRINKWSSHRLASATRLDQETIVVIVGDHGEGLGSHGEGTHGFFVYDYALHVPFIVASPIDELHGVRVDAQVSLVDVFPTVLALAGVDSSATVNGRSLLPVMFKATSPKQEKVYAYSESMPPSLQYGWSALHSLRSPRYKFIQAPRPELYDLAKDPGKRRTSSPSIGPSQVTWLAS